MTKTIARLFPFMDSDHTAAPPGWWESFGSFGDDIFCDEETDHVC
jgi:hypothetical protein